MNVLGRIQQSLEEADLYSSPLPSSLFSHHKIQTLFFSQLGEAMHDFMSVNSLN